MRSNGSTSQGPWLGSPSTFAGAGAGLVSSIITCPLDVIKTRLQAQKAARGRIDYLGVIGESLLQNNLLVITLTVIA